MKRKALSLMLCLFMVISLLPTFVFAADDVPYTDGIQGTDGKYYVSVGNMTVTQAQAWTNSSHDASMHVDTANGDKLYYNDGGTFRRAMIGTDPYYFSNPGNASTNTANNASGGTNHGWAKPNDDNSNNDMFGMPVVGFYYVDTYSNFHQLYYNANWYNRSSYPWKYRYEVFFATNKQEVNIASESAYTSAIDKGDVKKLSANGGIQSSTDTWYIPRTCHVADINNQDTTIQNL